MENIHENDARIFKAFCDENRLEILSLLRSGEKCACVLLEELDICQSTLSHHMKILCDSGIIISRRQGKWTHYSLSDEGCAFAKKRLDVLTSVTETNGDFTCRASCECD